MLDFFKTLVIYPVDWFWDRYTDCIEEKQYLKLVLLLLFSVFGLIAIGGCLVMLVNFVIDYANSHAEIVLLIGGLIWLYLYGKSRRKKMAEIDDAFVTLEEKELAESAAKGYPTISSALYRCLKLIADEYECRKPLSIGEIEMPEEKYEIANGVPFYFFKLAKRQLSTEIDEELFRQTLQSRLHDMIHAGQFPSITDKSIRDSYNNTYDAITIDHVSDLNSYIEVCAVYTTETYMDHLRNQKVEKMRRGLPTDDITVDWKEGA